MKKILTAALGLFAFAFVAIASTPTVAADVPNRAALPARPVMVVPTFAKTGFYVSGHAGGATLGKGAVVGVGAGYDFGMVRLEADYDYLGGKKGVRGHMFTANAILEHDFDRFTPYVLAGAGFRFADDVKWNERIGVYVLGAGLRYAVTDNLDIDGRYRYVAPFQFNKGRDHLFTVGVNYRF
jgi:Opacity protein and related surface antigens